MRVVICDDEPLARERLTRIVREEGHEVVAQAATGIEAIAKVKETAPDVILLDIRMPEMDGIALIKEVRKMDAYQRVPILFLTTESQAAKKMEAKEAGATGWIIKPFVPAKLIAALNKVLR